MTELKLRIKLRKFNLLFPAVAQKTVKKVAGIRVRKKLVRKIANTYLDILKQELLEKGVVNLGSGIGSLHVYKYPVEKFPKYMEGVANGTKKPQSTNLSRINYFYKIKYVRGKKILWVRFSACDGLKKQLIKILNNTDKDYRPAPIKLRK